MDPRHFGADPDPYLLLMDPDPAPDPTPDPTPFFINFKDAKKNIFFLTTYPQAHHLQSKKLNFFPKILC